MMKTMGKHSIKKPEWLKVKVPGGPHYRDLKSILNEHNLHTVCSEARCPNMEECWARRSATIMILGDTCTRSCRFCAVKTGRSGIVDDGEPLRVAEAIKKMQLKHVVLTSVDRDDLPDGGAAVWTETVKEIHEMLPAVTIEILIPDFNGNEKDLNTVFSSLPNVLSHNLETAEHLYKTIRPQADYYQSLNVLKSAYKAGLRTKSGIMLGLGEDAEDIIKIMKDARAHHCDIFTIGQYLQPTPMHIPVQRYVHPDEFNFYKDEGLKMGFRFVESAPLVRSSYHADAHVN
ncbi:MAG: lipoyl synthase [Candidatus Marinimicrobia bacterium]|nr:lipoyl synthase [Candidatus Neomarinimicrobiota bacterium]